MGIDLSRPLKFGIYEATPAFREIKMHSCVCFGDDLGVVAVTGPAGSESSQAYAELFANAPLTAEHLKKAQELLRKALPLIQRSKRIIEGESGVPHLIVEDLMSVDIEIDDFLVDLQRPQE
mgnify:CR=1 FL=1